VALLFIFSTVGAPFWVFAFTEADARLAIVAAENEVVDCYTAVSETEKAGANVTGLLSILNEAGKLLSKANLAYSIGDFDSAWDFAVSSQEKLDGFLAEADGLRRAAMHERYLDFMVNIAGSIVGAISIICGSFAVWFFLKQREETGVWSGES